MPEGMDSSEAQRPAAVPPHLVALAQAGCGIAIASSTAELRPLLGMGVACRVRNGVFRILVDRGLNAALLTALAAGRPVAVTITATRDHTSFQIKADGARICPACSDDMPEVDRQHALLAEGLTLLGFTPAQSTGYSVCDPGNLVAVELVPGRIFSQTPGPGAGREIDR